MEGVSSAESRSGVHAGGEGNVTYFQLVFECLTAATLIPRVVFTTLRGRPRHLVVVLVVVAVVVEVVCRTRHWCVYWGVSLMFKYGERCLQKIPDMVGSKGAPSRCWRHPGARFSGIGPHLTTSLSSVTEHVSPPRSMRE